MINYLRWSYCITKQVSKIDNINSVPEHQRYYDQMQNARYTLLNKAIIGVADVEGDIAERLDRWFAIDVNTTHLP